MISEKYLLLENSLNKTVRSNRTNPPLTTHPRAQTWSYIGTAMNTRMSASYFQVTPLGCASFVLPDKNNKKPDDVGRSLGADGSRRVDDVGRSLGADGSRRVDYQRADAEKGQATVKLLFVFFSFDNQNVSLILVTDDPQNRM